MKRSLDMRILGPLEVVVDGTPRNVGGPKQQTALAVLVVFANEVVSTDRLIDELWPAEAPRTARKTLQRYLSHLRARLDRPDRIEFVSAGYRLVLDADELDAARFERLVDDARIASDASSAADALEAALGQWRGAALDGMEDSPVLAREAGRLEERRLSVLESLIDRKLALGRHADLVPELEALVAQHPQREPFLAQLMIALYRSGRQADALRCYQRAYRFFVEELGLDPAPDLRQLELRILRHDPTLAVDLPAAGRNLPLPRSAFVGREVELAEVGELLRHRRLVTLVGPAGVGKTRLAIQVGWRHAADHPDGVWMANLAPLATSDTVTDAVCAALRLPDHARRLGPDGLVRRLADRRLLLILDNCEHVVDAVAEFTEALAEAPAVAVLATSRLPLQVEGEIVFDLDPLALPGADRAADATDVRTSDAVRLFVERAREARARIELADVDYAFIADICRSVDGLPLGIELAAGQIRARTLAEIAEQVGDPLQLLELGMPRGDQRHRTLAAAVNWSYRLLPDATQELFRALSSFAAGFDAAPALSVAVATEVPRADVAMHLDRLVDTSLLSAERSGRTSRFEMLEVIRQFAREQLRAAGEEAAARTAHASLYASKAGRAAHGLRTSEREAWLDAIARDHIEYRAALEWSYGQGLIEQALRIVEPLGYFWTSRGSNLEGAEWLPKLLTDDAESAVELRAGAATAAAHAFATLGQFQEAAEYSELAESLARRSNDEERLLDALISRVRLAVYRDDRESANQLVAEIMGLSGRQSFPRQQAEIHAWAGQVAAADGRWDAATRHLFDSYRLFGLAGAREGASQIAALRAVVAVIQNDLEAAADWARRAHMLLRGYEESPTGVLATSARCIVELRHGASESARASAWQTLEQAHRIGWTAGVMRGFQVMAAVALAEGTPELAAILWGKAEGLRNEIGYAAPVGDVVFRPDRDAARRQLGDLRFRQLLERGRELPVDEALDYARRRSRHPLVGLTSSATTSSV